ncbi:CHAD domain-containing protein [Aquihabitans sp. McL0605]|uniref:CYTH and CHAD domain-containing protein n=1 Tax=Aquihabitans sp. McL0605 TaxID=3415671 RepID=UPI003CFA07A3
MAERETRTEREVKLAPPPGFELADLSALVGADVRALPPADLVATYFDTHDLVLARSGITIRHRTGEGAPTWTVKLPAGEHAGALVRREIDIEGDRARRPRELAATVMAHLRGRRLGPVAEVRSQRDRALIEDGAGQALVEVVHDHVTAVRGRRLLGSWEEVEVEAMDAPGALDAQRRVVRALRKAGSAKAPAVPKLVRALGDEAAAAPDLIVPELPAHPKVIDALELAIARSVVQILEHDPAVRVGGDPEDLHQLRVATRRLRSDLRTFRGFLDADVSARVRDELRWVADQTNELRDLDVLRAWLVAKTAALPDDDRPAMEELIGRCDEQAAARRAVLLRALGSPRYGALVHDLVHLLETPPAVDQKQERRARKRLDRQVRRRWHELEALMGALGDDHDDADLHQARIAAKRCRAAVEAVIPLVGRDARRLARALAKLQDVLGAVHDASVTEAWLRQVRATPAAFAAGELAVLARIDGRVSGERWPDVWAKVERRHAAM